jgi:hypothetical protein
MKKREQNYYFEVTQKDGAIHTKVKTEGKDLLSTIDIEDFREEWDCSASLKEHYIHAIFPAMAEAQDEALADIYDPCDTHEEALAELSEYYKYCIEKDLPRIPQYFWDERDCLQRIADGEEEEEADESE